MLIYGVGGDLLISYDPLWKQLIDKRLKKSELCKMAGISSATMSKMGRREYVALAVIDKICLVLACRVEDVLEIIHP